MMGRTRVIAGTIKFYMGNEVLRETKYTSKSDRERHINSFQKMAQCYGGGYRFWYTISPRLVVVGLSHFIPDEKAAFERPKAEYSNKNYIH